MTKKNILISIIALLFSSVSFGQTDVQHDIKLITKDYGDKHVLRWGFTSPESWYFAMKTGVEVYQLELKESGTEYTKIADVMPMNESDLEQMADAQKEHQEMLVIVLQNIHRDWENSQYEDSETLLEKSDNFVNRYSLVHFAADKDFLAAEAAGLRFETDEYDPDKKYAYEVRVKGRYPSSDLSIVFPNRNFTPLIYDIQEKEEMVILRWDRSMHENKFSAFYIERSSDGKNFERLLDIPYVQMFDESIINESNFFTFLWATENEREYQYRIIGIDAFGDMSDPSPVVSASGRDLTPPARPVMKLVKNVKHLQCDLTWEQEGSSDVVNYFLEHTFEGEKEIIADFAKPTDRQKIFKVSKRGLHNFRLIALDKNGNASFSDEYFSNAIDIYPPSPPTGLTAEADTNGVVQLIWDQAIEDDVVGYYVFSADANDRSFRCLTKRSHSYVAYVDSLNLALLNEQKYYKVVAIDSDGKRSKFSEEVLVKYPDIIPPSPALISDYKVANNYIQLELRPSSSKDVVKHVLERKTSEGEWSPIFEGLPERPLYKDSTIRANTKYQYRFYAIDDAGLQSKVIKDLTVKSKRADAKELGITITQVGDHVSVSWDDDLNLERIILFKKWMMVLSSRRK